MTASDNPSGDRHGNRPDDGGGTVHPYADLPPRAFWRTGVAMAPRDGRPGAPADIARPKFTLPPDAAIVTAGSCFAQHVARALRMAGLRVIDAEPAPPGIGPEAAAALGFGVYAARHGNIYTSRQMRQLVADAAEGRVDPEAVWPRGAGYVDALRPTVEPGEYDRPDHVMGARRLHLGAVRRALQAASHLIFTLGLTECWVDRQSGRAFPLAPGVAGGRFDPARHALTRLRHPDIMADLSALRSDLQRLNPGLRLILTVSPVALTATAADEHVLTASIRSKATLLSAARDFAEDHGDVDYFPSYEIATNPATRGAYLARNLREITPQGVSAVMQAFLSAHGLSASPPRRGRAPRRGTDAAEVDCDEVLLDAYAPGGRAG